MATQRAVSCTEDVLDISILSKLQSTPQCINKGCQIAGLSSSMCELRARHYRTGMAS